MASLKSEVIDQKKRYENKPERSPSGLETVVQHVTAILALYKAGSQLVKRVQESQRTKGVLQPAPGPEDFLDNLGTSLAQSHRIIQSEYDRHSKRLGDPWALGDGE